MSYGNDDAHLLRIDVEDLGRCGTSDVYKATWVEFTSMLQVKTNSYGNSLPARLSVCLSL